MSRAKRTRKARMAARQARRYTITNSGPGTFFAETLERARFRRDLNASDAPDAMKTVLGLLADPVGFAVDRMQQFAEGEPK